MMSIIKLIKALLISTIMLPLDVVLIPIALISLSIKKIIKRTQDIEGDLKTAIPVLSRKIKLIIKNRKK